LHHLLLAGLPAHLCENSKNLNAMRMIFFRSIQIEDARESVRT
jgi:hypothetical protein